MSDVLNADQILAVDDVQTERVNVPEWGGDVIVRSISGTDRDSYEASMTVQKGDKFVSNPVGARARLVVRALVKEDGSRLFGDGQSTALSEKNAAVLDRLWDVAARLSGITPAAVEDAEGNSDAPTGDDSPSD